MTRWAARACAWHITGYAQPKDEWFQFLKPGRFDYHQITIDDKSVSLVVKVAAAELTGRGIFNPTINGARNPWRLQFTMRLAKRGERWIIARSSYTTFLKGGVARNRGVA